MNYRLLGRTALRVSEIGLGTMVHAGHFGPMDDRESLAAIEAAMELGVNFIDTSDAYGAGKSEALLGQALRGRREQVILATKGGTTMVGPHRGKRDYSPPYISRVLEESLRRLQTDYVDLYQLHNPPLEVIERGEVFDLLDKRREDGKIRFYGVSVNRDEVALASIRSGKVDVIQIEYSILDQTAARQVFPLAQAVGVGVIARVPLRRGLLTGKFTPEDEDRFHEEDVRVRHFPGERFQRELVKVELCRFLLKGPIHSLAQAALAFCLAHPAVSTTIAGARNAHQMRENAAASGVRLSQDHLRRLRELWERDFRVPMLYVLRRGDTDRFRTFQERLEQPGLARVMWDRRIGERRTLHKGVMPERRGGDRRGPLLSTWATFGFVAVPQG